MNRDELNIIINSNTEADWQSKNIIEAVNKYIIEAVNKYEVDAYNKAIDAFADKAIKIVYEANNRDRNPQPRDMVADIHYKFIEFAEQLKEGEKNEKKY